MKKTTLFLSGLFFCINLLGKNSSENEISKQTYIYAIKESDTLRLDKYDQTSIVALKPCVVFMFGGGFFSGSRDDTAYNEYFIHLVKSGYVVISIDYRLGMKDTNGKSMLTSLANSVDIAVEDLFDATSFILDKRKEWNIDPTRIIASGSSAGAISVLHGIYSIANEEKVTEKLPRYFNYTGAISFAGAIFSMQGAIKWKNKPCPMMLFHGDADKNVPFEKISLFRYGAYGSKYIAGQLQEMKSPYYFYEITNAAHEIATFPMQSYLEEITSFLDKFVLQQQPLMIHTTIHDLNIPEAKKKFGIRDYLKSNF